jgi:hypothetical protein
MNFCDYGLINVLINSDEEVSSAASRAMLTKPPFRGISSPTRFRMR